MRKKATVRVTKWLSDIPVEAQCTVCPTVSFIAKGTSHRPNREEFKQSLQSQFDEHCAGWSTPTKVTTSCHRDVRQLNERNGLFTTGTPLGTQLGMEYAAAVMKQPPGVLVIMGYFLVGASTVFPLIGRLPRLPLLQSLPLLANVVALLFVAGGLYKMQGWSRWASIAILAIELVRIAIRLVEENPFANMTIAGIYALFIVWEIRYLTRPFAKAAFRLASLKRSPETAAPPQ